MTKILYKNINHANIYFVGLILMAIALPSSAFLMSFAQLILAINWLWEKKYNQKLKSFFHNKIALVITSLFILHIIGLLWTNDFNYAFKDLRIKSPLFILPFIISTSPLLNKKRFEIVLLFFVASVVVCSFISVFTLLTHEIIDIRAISVFISHIRFGLLIDLSIFILSYLLFKKTEYFLWIKIIFALILCWLIIFLFLLEAVTGLAILICTFFLFMLYIIFTKKILWKKIIFSLLIICVAFCVFSFLKNVVNEYNYKHLEDIQHLDKYTSQKNQYINYLDNNDYENGYRTWIYFCPQEIEYAWNKKSKIKYLRKDKANQQLQYTLIRFLTSKGYRKDADGVNKLTYEEICAVERGIANYKYMGRFNIRYRIYQTFCEYDIYKETGNPSNCSLMQRFEFWNASWRIIKNNWQIGVGTGDLPDAFKNEYIKMNTKLDVKQRWRSHNQYLSITVAFGIIGFIWFLIFLFYPAIKTKKIQSYYFFIFFLIFLLSMLTEDTIETQAGVSFIAFFYSFFIFAEEKQSNKKM